MYEYIGESCSIGSPHVVSRRIGSTLSSDYAMGREFHTVGPTRSSPELGRKIERHDKSGGPAFSLTLLRGKQVRVPREHPPAALFSQDRKGMSRASDGRAAAGCHDDLQPRPHVCPLIENFDLLDLARAFEMRPCATGRRLRIRSRFERAFSDHRRLAGHEKNDIV